MDMSRRAHRVTAIATFLACLTLIASTVIGAVSANFSRQAAEAALATVEEAKISRVTAQRQLCLDELVTGQTFSLVLFSTWTNGTDFDPASSLIPRRDAQQELTLLTGALKAATTCSTGPLPEDSGVTTSLGHSLEDLGWALFQHGLTMPKPSQQELDTCAWQALQTYIEASSAATDYLRDLLREGEADPSFVPESTRCSAPEN
jgi:hypothetical protein